MPPTDVNVQMWIREDMLDPSLLGGSLFWATRKARLTYVSVRRLLIEFGRAGKTDQQGSRLLELSQFCDFLSDNELEWLIGVCLPQEDHRIRGQMCYLLGRTGRPRFIPKIQELLYDPDPWVCEQAAKALEKLERRASEFLEELERLRGASEQDRVQAASELNRMHIRARGAVRTRGSLSQAALSEFPVSPPDAMSQTLVALCDQSPAIRREVAAALGEWGGATAADILHGMAKGPDQDADEGVRRACVRALGLIGGPVAVEGLCTAAEHDPAEAVRRDGINALVELALQESTAPRVGTQDAVCTRRSRVHVRSGLSPEAKAVLAVLKRISDDESEKEYLRQKAKVGLSTLAELS